MAEQRQAKWFVLAIAAGIVSFFLLLLLRSYSWDLAVISAVSIAALVLMTVRAVQRLRAQLGQPPFEREK